MSNVKFKIRFYQVMMQLMIYTFLLGKCFSNELGIFIQLKWTLIDLNTSNQRNAFCAAVLNMHAYIIHPLILFFLIRIYLNNQNYIQSNIPFIFFLFSHFKVQTTR